MPRLKKSKGKMKVTTVFPDEFQRYLMYELANSRHWNPKSTHGGMTGPNRWEYSFRSNLDAQYNWHIEYNGKEIIVTSDQPKVEIRKGLYFEMGNARLVVDGEY
jgi:hypothetical protein